MKDAVTKYFQDKAVKHLWNYVINIGRENYDKKKKVYSKKITENYFMKNLDASDEKLKDKAYLAIAEMYCR